MLKNHSKILISTKINISVSVLQNVVANTKELSKDIKNEVNRIDTADKLSELISNFLEEKNFELYTNQKNNY